MPEYNYDCKKCGKLRITQSIKDAHLITCPYCGSIHFKRVLSDDTGFVIKGFSMKNKYSKGNK